MARLIPTPGIELYKLERRVKHALTLGGKVSVKDDIIPAAIAYQRSKIIDNIRMRRLSFTFDGFEIFKIPGPGLFVSIPGRYIGWDILLFGEFNGPREVLASYKKIDKRRYELIRVCELNGNFSAEGRMICRHFTNAFLRRICGFNILENLGRKHICR